MIKIYLLKVINTNTELGKYFLYVADLFPLHCTITSKIKKNYNISYNFY